MHFVSKMTGELTPQEIQDILNVLNTTFGGWGQDRAFRWKYSDNPYGQSVHAIGYDGDQPVGYAAFWRANLEGLPAYECVDLAVVPSHRNQGILGRALETCISSISEEYLYAYPSHITRRALMKVGLSLERRLPVTFNLAPIMLRRYNKLEQLPDDYVEWRYLQHPTNKYYVSRAGESLYLLIKRRENMYVAAGRLSQAFGLKEVRPPVVFSYDFPGRSFRFPRKRGFFLENISRYTGESVIPAYVTDRF